MPLPVDISEGVNFSTPKKPLQKLKTEYTFVRYITCIGETQAEVIEPPRPSERKRAIQFYITRIQVALGGGDNRYKG